MLILRNENIININKKLEKHKKNCLPMFIPSRQGLTSMTF